MPTEFDSRAGDVNDITPNDAKMFLLERASYFDDENNIDWYGDLQNGELVLHAAPGDGTYYSFSVEVKVHRPSS